MAITRTSKSKIAMLPLLSLWEKADWFDSDPSDKVD
jgi:hypothetical protein